jgi:hypothetical protein
MLSSERVSPGSCAEGGPTEGREEEEGGRGGVCGSTIEEEEGELGGGGGENGHGTGREGERMRSSESIGFCRFGRPLFPPTHFIVLISQEVKLNKF